MRNFAYLCNWPGPSYANK